MKPLDWLDDSSLADSHHRPASGVRRVFIDRLEIEASVGVYPHEHHRRQRLHVWLVLDVADRYDGLSDRLSDVYDYDDAIAIVRTTAADRHFNLLERLSEEIAAKCLDDTRVSALRLRIAKPDAVPGSLSVGVEIERRRAGG